MNATEVKYLIPGAVCRYYDRILIIRGAAVHYCIQPQETALKKGPVTSNFAGITKNLTIIYGLASS
jgi:hypothetical protein